MNLPSPGRGALRERIVRGWKSSSADVYRLESRAGIGKEDSQRNAESVFGLLCESPLVRTLDAEGKERFAEKVKTGVRFHGGAEPVAKRVENVVFGKSAHARHAADKEGDACREKHLLQTELRVESVAGEGVADVARDARVGENLEVRNEVHFAECRALVAPGNVYGLECAKLEPKARKRVIDGTSFACESHYGQSADKKNPFFHVESPVAEHSAI